MPSKFFGAEVPCCAKLREEGNLKAVAEAIEHVRPQ
jgi:hypothetical protein